MYHCLVTINCWSSLPYIDVSYYMHALRRPSISSESPLILSRGKRRTVPYFLPWSALSFEAVQGSQLRLGLVGCSNSVDRM